MISAVALRARRRPEPALGQFVWAYSEIHPCQVWSPFCSRWLTGKPVLALRAHALRAGRLPQRSEATS
jgi:hypothetical protein